MDEGDDFGVVGDVECAATKDVCVALVEFAEAAALGAFAAVGFADLADFKWEVEGGLVFGDVGCEWDGEVEAEGEFVVAFFEAVDLLFGVAAGFCEEEFFAVDDWGFDWEEAVAMMRASNYLFNAVKFDLVFGQKLHEARERCSVSSLHARVLLFCWELYVIWGEIDRV